MKIKYRLGIIIIIYLFTGTLIISAQETEISDPEIIEGIRLFRENKLDESIRVLQRVLQKKPEDAVAHNAIGVVYSQSGDSERALRHFDMAISLRKGFFRAIYNKLNLLITQNKYDESMALLQELVKDYPEHADGWANLGIIYSQSNKLDEALECFDKVLQINDNDSDIHLKKGQLLLLQKKYEEACIHFRKALEIAPKLSAASHGLKIAQEIIEKKKNGYIRIRQILVKTHKAATQLKTDLESGADFAQIARKHSEDSTAKYGGDLGFVGRGSLLQEIEDAIFALEIEEVSEIVQTTRGFHIFKRIE